MRFVRYAILVLIASFAIGPALEAADSDGGGAPFALQWGMSVAQAQGLGVMLTKDSHKGFGASYVATNLPKMIGDVRAVLLSFGFDDKLWRVVAISKDFPNDPYGSAVQRRYEELAGDLAQKYGSGKKESGTSDEFYADPKHFVYAIQSGNAWYYIQNTKLLQSTSS